MKVVMMPVPEALAPYVEFQIAWIQKRRVGKLEMNFFKGGVTNMNINHSLKLVTPEAEVICVTVEAGER